MEHLQIYTAKFSILDAPQVTQRTVFSSKGIKDSIQIIHCLCLCNIMKMCITTSFITTFFTSQERQRRLTTRPSDTSDWPPPTWYRNEPPYIL